MGTSVHTEQLSSTRPPLFIADNDGIFAKEIVTLVSAEFLPVVLTRKNFSQEGTAQAVFVSYKQRIPRIPDNQFVAFYFVQEQEDQSELFESLYREAKNRNLPFFYIAQVNTLKKKTFERLLSFQHAKIFLYGELVSGALQITPSLQIIRAAKKHGKIVLSQQGLSPVFPVTKQFVVDAIVRYSLVEKHSQQCLAFLPEGDMYEISLARILKQLLPMLKVDFAGKRERGQMLPQLPSDCKVVTEPNASLRKGLRVVLEGILPETPAQATQGIPRRTSRFFSRVLISFLLVALLFGFFLFGMAFFGQRLLIGSLQMATSLQFSKSQKNAGYARDAFAVSGGALRLLLPGAKVVSLQGPLIVFEKKLQAGEDVAAILVQSAGAGQVYKDTFFSKKPVSKNTFIQATQVLKNNLLAISQMQAEGKIPRVHGEALAQHQKTTDLFLTAADILPDILGFGKGKKYLLLFQNNNELRPAGGFIGSYAVISVKNGKVGEFLVNDVYSADGQLTGHVEPPVPLKKHLGLTHWYLRDSNFSPDFPESAASAAFFLNLETGEKVDGVIAVDTDFLRAILAALGPVHLPSSGLVVSEKNVVKLTQEQVEKDFFAGSSQKKDFLNELFAGVEQKFNSEASARAGGLFAAAENSLLQKHMIVAFAEKKLQDPFLLQGVSSTLQTPKAGEKEVQDFFGVNEANLGTNKVNMYVERKFSYAVSLEQSGDIRVRVEEVLQNTSKNGSPFGGEYKAYLRFILPEGVSPEEISIDGKKQVVLAPLADEAAYAKRGAVAANTLEVERVDIKGKSTYGFFLTVPPLAKKTIAIAYTLHPKGLQPTGSYSLTLFKQPGTGPDPYVFSLSLPDGYALRTSNVRFEKDGPRFFFISRLATDQQVFFSYGKK